MADLLASLTINGTQYISEEELANLKLFHEFPEGLTKFASVCCMLYMIIGIPGNVITIVALARCKKVRNATAIFIINLSFCDLLHCFFNLPFIASTFWSRSWLYGAFLCRLVPVTRYALVCTSLTIVLAITINRYVMIGHPQIYAMIFSQRNLIIMVGGIWIYSFGMLLPTWLEAWGRFGMDTTIGFCAVIPDENNRSPVKILFICAFVIPCLAIIICYGRIYFIVRKTTAKNGNNKPKNLSEITSAAASSGAVSSHSDIELSNFPPHLSLNSDDESSKLNAVDKRHPRIVQLQREFRSSRIGRSLRAPRKFLPSSKDKKLLAMITVITITFFVCNLPITLVKLNQELSTFPVMWTLSYLLRYSSTCINPVLYVLMSNEYRKAYRKVFCRRRKLSG